MGIALYARVDSMPDTDNQLAQLREFARAQKWTIVYEYVDRATSKHSDREQFRRLFEDASRRKFDLVLLWSLDRFSRFHRSRTFALATVKKAPYEILSRMSGISNTARFCKRSVAARKRA